MVDGTKLADFLTSAWTSPDPNCRTSHLAGGGGGGRGGGEGGGGRGGGGGGGARADLARTQGRGGREEEAPRSKGALAGLSPLCQLLRSHCVGGPRQQVLFAVLQSAEKGGSSP